MPSGYLIDELARWTVIVVGEIADTLTPQTWLWA
jgi:hypothetical protein